MLASVFCEYMGLKPGFTTAVQAGGATACTAVMLAAALVARRDVQPCPGRDRRQPPYRTAARRRRSLLAQFGHPEFEQPYGISVPAAYALVAQRYMHEYGVTDEQLAAIAVTAARACRLHPHAHMREPHHRAPTS